MFFDKNSPLAKAAENLRLQQQATEQFSEAMLDEELEELPASPVGSNASSMENEVDLMQRKLAKLDEQRRSEEDRLRALSAERRRQEASNEALREQHRREEAQRLRDEKHHAEQTLLRSEYDQLMLFAGKHAELHNYDAAIREYSSAIRTAQKLISAWKTHEREKNIFALEPSNRAYNLLIAQAQLQIATCQLLSGEAVTAYLTIKDIPSNELEMNRIIEVQLEKCRIAIREKISRLVQEVMELDTRNNLYLIPTAKQKLQVAKALCTTIGDRTDALFNRQEQRISWDEQRQHVNQQCKILLGSPLEFNDYSQIVARMRDTKAAYSRHQAVLDTDELNFAFELENFMQPFEAKYAEQLERERLARLRTHHINCQRKINELLSELSAHLTNGNIPAAYECVEIIIRFATDIRTPSDVIDSGLHYTPPEFFTSTLQKLALQRDQFEARAKAKSVLISDTIIACAIEQINNAKPDSTLLETDIAKLKQALAQLFINAWHKFDRRLDPTTLIDNLAQLIAYNTETIGYFNYDAWRHWSYATTCLTDLEQLSNDFKATINAFDLRIAPEPIVELDIFARVVPPPSETMSVEPATIYAEELDPQGVVYATVVAPTPRYM